MESNMITRQIFIVFAIFVVVSQTTLEVDAQISKEQLDELKPPHIGILYQRWKNVEEEKSVDGRKELLKTAGLDQREEDIQNAWRVFGIYMRYLSDSAKIDDKEKKLLEANSVMEAGRIAACSNVVLYIETGDRQYADRALMVDPSFMFDIWSMFRDKSFEHYFYRLIICHLKTASEIPVDNCLFANFIAEAKSGGHDYDLIIAAATRNVVNLDTFRMFLGVMLSFRRSGLYITAFCPQRNISRFIYGEDSPLMEMSLYKKYLFAAIEEYWKARRFDEIENFLSNCEEANATIIRRHLRALRDETLALDWLDD